MYELMVEDSFDAAHALRNYEGPCENLHGHTWKVQVFIKGDRLNEIGLLEDFKIIKRELTAVLNDFDHKLLNDVRFFIDQNPTSESIAEVIYKELKNNFKNISKVTVWESASTNASYY